MNRILYLHGFASSPQSSKAQFFHRLLPQVEVLDLAEGDFENLSITRQLRVIERAASGDPVILIGSSMGGYLGALYAARHPEVARVVLMAPAFRFAHRWEEVLGPEKVEEWRRTGWIEVFHYADGRNRRLGYQLLEDARRYEDYPDFHQPALIFHGAHDDTVPAAYSETFAAQHVNGKLEILDSGHELLNVLDYIGARVASFV